MQKHGLFKGLCINDVMQKNRILDPMSQNDYAKNVWKWQIASDTPPSLKLDGIYVRLLISSTDFALRVRNNFEKNEQF